jgi:NifB/MoaA-like Fe-S oxidoreductase
MVCSGKTWAMSFLLPSVMLRQGQPVFLDDMTLATVQAQIPVPIRVVHGAADIVASVLSSKEKTP